MRFYSMAYGEVMGMPIRAFWVIGRNIDRVSSKERLDALHVATASQSSEGYATLTEELQSQMADTVVGDVVVESLDREGLDFLRNLSA
jgi:hypothetical protein